MDHKIAKDLNTWFSSLLGVALEDLHTIVENGNKLLNRNNDQSTRLHKMVYNAFDSDGAFRSLYERLIADIARLQRISGERVIIDLSIC